MWLVYSPRIINKTKYTACTCTMAGKECSCNAILLPPYNEWMVAYSNCSAISSVIMTKKNRPFAHKGIGISLPVMSCDVTFGCSWTTALCIAVSREIVARAVWNLREHTYYGIFYLNVHSRKLVSLLVRTVCVVWKSVVVQPRTIVLSDRVLDDAWPYLYCIWEYI